MFKQYDNSSKNQFYQIGNGFKIVDKRFEPKKETILTTFFVHRITYKNTQDVVLADDDDDDDDDDDLQKAEWFNLTTPEGCKGFKSVKKHLGKHHQILYDALINYLQFHQ